MGTSLCWDQPNNELPEGAAPQKRKEKEDSEIKLPFAGKSPDPNPCMPFIVNIYFLISALEISVLYNLRLGIKIPNAQSPMSSLQAFNDFV